MTSDEDKMAALESRFWDKVNRGDPDECWEWTGAIGSEGYGHITDEGKNRRSHRVSLELHGEELGDGWVLHKCDNPPCVNPNHLYVGDRSDNIKDMYERGQREPFIPDNRGENHPASKLTEEDVLDIRERIETGESQSNIAKDYGINQSTVSRAANGKLWSEVGQ